MYACGVQVIVHLFASLLSPPTILKQSYTNFQFSYGGGGRELKHNHTPFPLEVSRIKDNPSLMTWVMQEDQRLDGELVKKRKHY